MFKTSIVDEINRLGEEIELVCGDSKCLAISPRAKEVARLPVAEIHETENSIIAAFEFPGVSKEEIELNFTEGRIEVKVERKLEKEAKEKDSYAYEIRKHSFYGALPLPPEAVAENAEASYKDGILKVEIPKAKKQETRKKIEIK